MITSDRPHHDQQVERQGVGKLLTDVDVAGCLAGDPDRDPPGSGEAARSALTSCSSRCSTVHPRENLERGHGAVGRGAYRSDGDDTSKAARRWAMRPGRPAAGRRWSGGQIGDDEERPVGPWPNFSRDQVVRLVLRGVRVVGRRSSGRPEAQREGRDRDHHEDRDAHERESDRPRAGKTGCASGHGRGAHLVDEVRLLAAAQDSHPDEAEQAPESG